MTNTMAVTIILLVRIYEHSTLSKSPKFLNAQTITFKFLKTKQIAVVKNKTTLNWKKQLLQNSKLVKLQKNRINYRINLYLFSQLFQGRNMAAVFAGLVPYGDYKLY
ncbi:MAG: hypothetical protein [Microviridae sp.]|nr:MAG: hypothetical protein [Microviridae sp.]